MRVAGADSPFQLCSKRGSEMGWQPGEAVSLSKFGGKLMFMSLTEEKFEI